VRFRIDPRRFRVQWPLQLANVAHGPRPASRRAQKRGAFSPSTEPNLRRDTPPTLQRYGFIGDGANGNRHWKAAIQIGAHYSYGLSHAFPRIWFFLWRWDFSERGLVCIFICLYCRILLLLTLLMLFSFSHSHSHLSMSGRHHEGNRHNRYEKAQFNSPGWVDCPLLHALH
jgi:hypothetical protein